MAHFEYILLLIGCLIVTVPLEFIYGFRVWRSPIRLLRAVSPGFFIFWIWDLVAIHRGYWHFNKKFVTGVQLPGAIPVEELLFFLVIPAAAISGFEAVRAGLARGRRGRADA